MLIGGKSSVNFVNWWLYNYTFTHAMMTYPQVYHVYSHLVFTNGCVYYPQAINHLICRVRFRIEAAMFGGTKITCVYLSEWESSPPNTSLSLLVKDKLWCCIKAEAVDSLMDCDYLICLFLCFVSRNLYTHTAELRPSADMYSMFWWILEGCACVWACKHVGCVSALKPEIGVFLREKA